MSNKEKFTPLSYSSLKAFAKSPKEFLAYKERTLESTVAMRMGSLIHLLILEPHMFPKKYAIYKGARRAGKEWTDFIEKYGDKREIIKTSEFEEANRVAEAVRQHPTSQLLIKSCNHFEKLVEDKIEGIPIRGFVDAYSKTHIIDIKTCQDASPRSFEKSAYNFHYNLQAAIYMEALKKKVNKNVDYFIIAVEKKSPYHVSVMKATDDFITSGRFHLRRLINEFKEWDGSSIGYEWREQSEVFDLDVPYWAKDYEKAF